MDALPPFFAALVFGYLCGSIPFGILLTRLTGGPDLRAIGSGNIGATNVLRTGRKGLAAATLVGDMLKGTAAVLIARYFLGHDFAIAAALGDAAPGVVVVDIPTDYSKNVEIGQHVIPEAWD